jgi:hypothetical protein
VDTRTHTHMPSRATVRFRCTFACACVRACVCVQFNARTCRGATDPHLQPGEGALELEVAAGVVSVVVRVENVVQSPAPADRCPPGALL